MKRSFVSKTDLAVAYFPHLQPEVARHKLMEYINSIPTLMARLNEVGYRRTCRNLSPKQVDMIFEVIGKPY